MALFGKDAKTYHSTTALDDDNTAADLTWDEVTNITDLNDNFTSEDIDVTTRASAVRGWTSEVKGPKSGEITFGVIMEANDTFVQALMDAWLNNTLITLLDMTGDKDTDGTFGLAANFSVGMQFSKPVKGVQTADVTLKASSFQEWVEGAA